MKGKFIKKMMIFLEPFFEVENGKQTDRMQSTQRKRSKLAKQHAAGNGECVARCDPPGVGLKYMKQLVFAQEMSHASLRCQQNLL